jgi:hypothetical protein
MLVAVAALILGAAALAVNLLKKPPASAPTDALVLRDRAGHERVRLAARDVGGSIELVGDDGHARASLRQDGETVILEFYAKGTAAHAVALQSTGDGGLLELSDSASQARVKVGASNGAGFSITTPRAGVSLGVTPKISSRLQLYFGDHTAWIDLSEQRAEFAIDGKDVPPP